MIPTAEEFLQKYQDQNSWSIEGAMIEFAKLHVEAALNSAFKETLKTKFPLKESILNAYPLSNIK